MKSIRLCRYAIIGLLVTLSTAVAEPLSLDQLQDHILAQGTIMGRFKQCITQGNAHISGSGRFTFEPDDHIKLNFEQPKRYSIIFFSDGSQTKTRIGINRERPRFSQISRLMFSILRMDKAWLENHFSIDLSGSIDRFNLSLTPKRRLAKTIQSVEIVGADGRVSIFRIVARGRVISIHLFESGQSYRLSCG